MIARSPDLIVLDEQGQIVLAIEVKPKVHPLDREALRDTLFSYVGDVGTTPRLVLLIMSDVMTLFEKTSEGFVEHSKPTADVLGGYDRDFERYRSDGPYLESLVYRWLRDLVEREDTAKAIGLLRPDQISLMHLVRDPRRAA
jgi:hypothetical protein